jgi:hypothetical protein
VFSHANETAANETDSDFLHAFLSFLILVIEQQELCRTATKGIFTVRVYCKAGGM